VRFRHAALLPNGARKVAPKDFAGLRQQNPGIGANFLLEVLSVAPPLRHPVGGEPTRHWLENKDQASRTSAITSDERVPLSRLFDTFEGPSGLDV
jgi:hypothetical protein